MKDDSLIINSVSKNFGGLCAVNEVDLSAERGRITGLIGPNGAGKTTLFNVIAGVYPATKGNIFLNQVCLNGLPVHKRAELGIARTFQITRLFKGMTVFENIMVGGHLWSIGNKTSNFLAAGFRLPSLNQKELEIREYAIEMLNFIGLEKVKDEAAANLPHGQQRLVEIARALTAKPSLLLLDEPAAGLNLNEVDTLQEKLRSVITTTECTILLVEHDMRLVMNTCDWIYVLNFGNMIAEGSPQEIGKNKEVVKAYLGKEY